jgi:hypothetical protein
MSDLRDASATGDNDDTTRWGSSAAAGSDETPGELSSGGLTPATPAGSGGSASAGDETFGWTAGDDEPVSGGNDPRATAERMLGQLQGIIDNLATQAAPVVRQIGAKAAELAAVAADRAGPLAHKAADATADASVKLAERSRTWAADLRNKADEGAAGGASDAEPSGSGSVLQGVDDPIEQSAKDDPAEGFRS